MRYSKDQLDKAMAKREELISEWTRPELLSKFKNWDRKKINGIICGKSGHGKSSLINTIGKYFGEDFKSPVGINECTKTPLSFCIPSTDIVL